MKRLILTRPSSNLMRIIASAALFVVFYAFAWGLVTIWPSGHAQAQFGGSGTACGGDLNASCQVTGTHLSAPLPKAQGGLGNTTGIHGGANQVLCSIRAANFNATTDQACAIPATITAWTVSSVLTTNCSASMTLAAGGVYPAASKGGTALVAAAQIYTALMASTISLPMTLAANIATTRYTINTVYLSLTTAQGSAATCDFYVIGNDLT